MTIEELLQMTAERGASDLILTVGSAPALRIDKDLVFTQLETMTPDKIQGLIEPILNEDMKQDLKKLSEVGFIYSLPGWGRYRVTVFKQRGSLAVAVRLVPTKLPSLEELGIPQAPLKYFCNLKDGLVLVTGATGGGKSTTLASMLRIFNDEYAYHIITVEDPIEYLFKHNKSIIEQRSIPQDAPSFSSALKEALRQNPDVVVVGEIRDDETMRLTLNLAESGILTLATFHTASASDSINRILNFFPGEEEHVRRQLALILRGVFSQQLIPLSLKKGMVPAWEVLIVDERVATLIREGNLHQIDNVIETGSKLGMQSMDQTLISLFKRKLINRKEFLLRIRDKEREEVVKLLAESESLGEEVF